LKVATQTAGGERCFKQKISIGPAAPAPSCCFLLQASTPRGSCLRHTPGQIPMQVRCGVALPFRVSRGTSHTFMGPSPAATLQRCNFCAVTPQVLPQPTNKLQALLPRGTTGPSSPLTSDLGILNRDPDPRPTTTSITTPSIHEAALLVVLRKFPVSTLAMLQSNSSPTFLVTKTR
jgi:hypothetical protein